MNREQAINYLRSSGMSIEQIESVCEGLGCNAGHWENEYQVDIGLRSAQCSRCHRTEGLIAHDNGFGHDYEYPNYCSHCGAFMIGGEEENE